MLLQAPTEIEEPSLKRHVLWQFICAKATTTTTTYDWVTNIALLVYGHYAFAQKTSVGLKPPADVTDFQIMNKVS
ncbi:hypothetical protein C7Y47_08425 [Lysinibacillus sphaericus]|uniref:Uncharacterized protein n=1 Tax=Lysinibacillus sphaericus TaxID=1421 RepID=A0A544UN54_LYSSH|nr:hypothetical protein [Lysinibacillus sp. SDF0037]TQR35258.1 hypothetical protein C7Y47_08425 [Lysinibacillus sp. SDF0037]